MEPESLPRHLRDKFSASSYNLSESSSPGMTAVEVTVLVTKHVGPGAEESEAVPVSAHVVKIVVEVESGSVVTDGEFDTDWEVRVTRWVSVALGVVTHDIKDV